MAHPILDAQDFAPPFHIVVALAMSFQLSDAQKNILREKYIEQFRNGDSTARKQIIAEVQEALLPSRKPQDQIAFSKEVSKTLLPSEAQQESNLKDAKAVGTI